MPPLLLFPIQPNFPQKWCWPSDVQVLGLAGPKSGALVEKLTDEQDWPFLQAKQVLNTIMQSILMQYEAVSDQGLVWVQREAIFQGSCKAFLNGQICSNYYNMMYWERILQKNHLITCFRRFYQRPYHLAAQMPMLGWVDVGKLIKVANIHSGFYVCYTN